MREFLTSQEAADELSSQTGKKWTVGHIHQKAAAGQLPVCFLYRGYLGLFSVPMANGLLFSTKWMYWVGYLRSNDVQTSLPTGKSGKTLDLLCPRNVAVAMPAHGYELVEVPNNQELRTAGENGESRARVVRMSEWVFHSDDLAKLIIGSEKERRNSVENFAKGDEKINSPSPNTAPMVDAKVAPDAQKKKRRGWRNVAWPYMVQVFNAGRYTTAKQFFKALEAKAGAESPFDRGTGPNADCLYVREISQSLSLKTVENAWAEIRSNRNLASPISVVPANPGGSSGSVGSK